MARYSAASLRGCITGRSTQAGFDWLFGLLFFAHHKCVHFRVVVGTVFDRVALIQRSVSSLNAYLKNLPALLDSVNIRLAESLLENSPLLSSWAFRGYYDWPNELPAVLALSQTRIKVPCATSVYFGRAIPVVDKLKYYCHRLVWFEGIWDKPHLINAECTRD